MLTTLSIRNVVLIDKLDLDFKSGLSVLTGETGAGKSILLDSLGLVLGNRAETGLIRQGADKLSVSAEFDISRASPELSNLFNEYDLDYPDGNLVIKRTLNRDGKGKIFVNDQSISAKLLKEIGRCLVEVHGQFDNQGLLNPAAHRDILDAFGGYQSELDAVAQSWQTYRRAVTELANAEQNIARARSDEDDLRHWVSELEKISPVEDEEETLTQKRNELMNAEKIIESLNSAYGALNGNADIIGAVRQAQSAIDRANRLVDGRFDDIVNILEQTLINAEEAVNEIEDASRNVSLNQNELEAIEERLFTLRSLARKHQTTIGDLPRVLEDFRARLNSLEKGEDGITALRQAAERAKQVYQDAASQLSGKRKAAALLLDSKVMAELPPLKMDKARFVTLVNKQAETEWNDKGFDSVSFTVSTNPNSPQGPLNKIASGGELSRFMLALKVNLAQSSNVGTMIFDEVDAGIGGATAKAVGERLSRLAQDVQVMVVTHSPQVAASGDHHFKVEKSTIDNITTTTVRELNTDERQEEIARMLAGESISDEARAAARVLLSA